MAPEKGSLLARSDFPLYLVKALGERHFLVAGGGGQAKTGVANAIEIYEVKKNGEKVLSSSVCRHDLGQQAPMNGATFYDGRNHMFAAGLDDECHLFSIKYKVVSPTKSEKKSDSKEARKRKGETEEKHADENQTKHITFEVETLGSMTTDFGSDGAFQKVVQFGPDMSILATGGADGFLRVWKREDLTKLYEIEAHKSEIDDLCISPAGNRILTVCRDSCCRVWETKGGKKVADMEWPGKTEEYRFRACRYGLVEGKKDKFNIYTINIPCKRQVKPSPCFLAMWDSSKFTPKLITAVGTEVLSALAVSDDGVYVGVGMITGSVAVYISFNLSKLYYVKESHSIFVTGLEFMPTSTSARALTGHQDFTLLSISADNTIRVHQEPPRNEYSVLWLLIGFLIVVIALFWFMSEVGF